ncbi:hypothetical protein LEM8419_00848 [Neolewinella maritima]|uniref:Uncharacterized protein n=1 Tax=Neolewinella maritima TaxID=1383882 RepID=A0ABM9AYA3_9BACT|nr:hypothetical protein [Neolewinella maritima]CAH0999548.1 hypothetical protein LEM8419_00848 [Neolewinella maritima]
MPKNTMDLLLEARLQQLASQRRATSAPPPDLKKEVFRTLDLLDTIGEVGALFTGTLIGTAAEFIDLLEDPTGEGHPSPPPPPTERQAPPTHE